MEMQFKFDNNETLTLDVFDTYTNQRVFELCKECKTNNVGMYQRGMGSEIGRSYDGHWLTKTPVTHALDNIRKGFEYTSIEPPVKIGNSLTIEECNILHRVFTTKIKDKRYDRLDLQLINHGVHEYEQSLVTPNYMNFSTRNGINDCILGFDTMDNTETMSKYFFNIDEEYGYMSADVYLND